MLMKYVYHRVHTQTELLYAKRLCFCVSHTFCFVECLQINLKGSSVEVSPWLCSLFSTQQQVVLLSPNQPLDTWQPNDGFNPDRIFQRGFQRGSWRGGLKYVYYMAIVYQTGQAGHTLCYLTGAPDQLSWVGTHACC